MIHPSEVMSIVPVPVPAQRGVYRYTNDSGHLVYVGVTSTGALMNDGELWRRLPDETEAMILREMYRTLDAQDPPPIGAIRPRLGLWVDGERRR